MIQHVPSFPSSLKTIGNQAFYNCYRMQGQLVLPDSITYIGNSAFQSCSALTGDLTIPDLIITINDNTFNGCSGITSLHLSANLKTINHYAFQNCNGLSDTMVIPESVTFGGYRVFAGCTNLPAVHFNALNCATFGDYTYYAFQDCSSLTHVEIGPGVKYIPAYIFYGCTMIQHVPSFPSSLKTIGNQAFYNCYRMQGQLILPDSVTAIGNSAFYACSAMTGDLTIPNLVRTINEHTFNGCSGLTSLHLPSNLQSINNYAFLNCSGLSDTLVIPESVTFGGYRVFAGCTNLPAVHFNALNCATFGDYTYYAFQYCPKLKYLEIGDSVQTIPAYMFYNCSSIAMIRSYAVTPPTVNTNAFYNVPTNIPVFVPCGSGPQYAQTNGWSNFTWIIASSPYTFDVTTNHTEHGSVTVSQYPSCTNPSASFTAVPARGYLFSHWSDFNTQNPRTMSVTQNTMLRAIFQVQSFELTATSSNSSFGTVIGSGSYDYNTWVTIEAVPNNHYHFLYWNDGVTNNPRYVQVLDNISYTAFFAPDTHNITVASSDAQQGTVTGGGSFAYGANTVLTATANNHYHFVQWSDGSMDNPHTITVTNDATYTAQFAPDNYTVSVSSADNTMGNASGGGSYAYNTTALLTATPNTHYHFVQWLDGNTENPRLITVTENVSFIAQFAADVYTITILSADNAMGTVSGGGSFMYNDTVTITAIANNHYHFNQWSDGSTVNPRTITVTGDASYTAQFAPDNYTVTVSSADNSMGNVSGGGSYAYNTSALLTATPNAHYHFVQWLDGNTENPRLVTVTDNMSFMAQFAPDIYSIVATPADYTMGSVAGSGNYEYLSTATLTATPNQHYHFTQWTDNNIANPRTVTVTGDSAFTAQFALNHYTVTVLSSDHTMGAVSGGGDYAYNTSAILTATANDHYHFTQWSDGNTVNPRTITVTGDISFTAMYAPDNYIITVSSADITMGSVSGGGSYAYNTPVTLTATPNNHYHFSQWSDGSTANPRTIIVLGDSSFTALFAPDSYLVTVISADNNMGTVSGSGSYVFNSTATLSATANALYHFTQWSDGVVDNPRTITVVSDSVFTAQFAPNNFTITVVSSDNTMGTVSGSGSYAYNVTAVLIAIANTHYHFTQWSDGNTENPRVVTVTSNATYTAQFAPDNYTVTVASADNSMGSVFGGGSYPYNSTATLVAMANSHYHFTQWSDGNTENPRTITVTENTSYLAQFAADTYTITVSSEDNVGGTVSSGGSFIYNDTVTITATANNHYHFSQWTDGSTVNPRTIIVTGDASYTAQFAPDNYTVTVTSADNTMGNVSGSGSYVYNTTISLTATANAQYHFTQWSDGAVDNPRTITVVSDSVFIAQFAPNSLTITVVSSDNNMGTVSGGGNYAYNATAILIAIANTHYHFTQWSDGSTENPRVITVTSNATYTAQFTPDNYTVTVASADNSMGSVFGGGSYPYNSTATLVAMANTHYHFTQWSDGSTDNPHTVTVDGDASYLALFAPDYYTVTVNSSDINMGVASGGGSYAYNSTVSLTATANNHYHFTQWSDGNTENPRIITVTGNVTYTAMFAEDPMFSITVLSDNVEMGSVDGGGNYYQGEQALLVASPSEHYVFSHWSDGSTENPRTITVTENATYTAYFSGMMYYVSVSSSDPSAGYVSGEGYYEYGTQATVTANPYDGHAFVSWSDGSEDNPYTFTVLDNISLTAEFTGVGIDEHHQESISIHVNGHQIAIDGADGYPVVLYDLAGKVVASSTDANKGLYVYATGLYLLRIGKHNVYKVLIQD
jgi:ribosomal protein L18